MLLAGADGRVLDQAGALATSQFKVFMISTFQWELSAVRCYDKSNLPTDIVSLE